MPRWSPQIYLRFAEERARPFLDLIARVPIEPGTIVDLGCGPGQLTAALRDRWPAADILGLDSSPEMIARARTDNADPAARYELADVADWQPDRPPELVVSNAMFQWVPDHLAVIGRLRDRLPAGGALAIQVPASADEPNVAVFAEVAAQPPFAAHTAGIARPRAAGPQRFLDLLCRPGWSVDVWQTVYHHVLAGDDPVFRWASGSAARPFRQALPDELRAAYDQQCRDRLRAAFPSRPYGTVLPFRRTFAIAVNDGRARGTATAG